MALKYSHQLITGISFGLTSAVITTLGIIVGLSAATSSKLAVVTGIITIAIADGLSDAAGLHLAEESEIEKGKARHTQKEVWFTTLITFLSVSGFSLTFVIPVLFFPFKNAIAITVLWGILLLIFLNFSIAKIRKENPIKLISEHVLLALFVIIISNWIGNLISRWFK